MQRVIFSVLWTWVLQLQWTVLLSFCAAFKLYNPIPGMEADLLGWIRTPVWFLWSYKQLGQLNWKQVLGSERNDCHHHHSTISAKFGWWRPISDALALLRASLKCIHDEVGSPQPYTQRIPTTKEADVPQMHTSLLAPSPRHFYQEVKKGHETQSCSFELPRTFFTYVLC